MTTDVVGLRFVTEGYDQVNLQIRDYQRALKTTTDSIQTAARGADAAAAQYLKQVEAYRQTSAALDRVSQMQRDSARTAQEIVNRAAGVTNAYKSAAESADVFVQALRRQEVESAKAARAQQEHIAQLMRIEQPYRSAKDSADVFVQAQDRARQGYERLRATIDPAVAAQQRYAEAERQVTAAVQQGVITKQQGAATLAQFRQGLVSTAGGLNVMDTAAGRARAQLLATANSVAILDGPLGGIASRFSALGVLIGRTGLIMAGALVGFAAFGAILNRGIRNLVAWEVQAARINAILRTTGYQAGLTGEEIANMSSRIALATLESEQSVRAAAARLLTFRDVSSDVFERVLVAATDMASLGFGTVESESLKLAKALEDPAQALTSLSRAGIVFTRQQRQLIISLVESGQRAEAMERILANVESRVGGAGAAAAADTLAGSMDTVSQATSRATRRFADFLLEVSGVRQIIESTANLLEMHAVDDSPESVRLANIKEVFALESQLAEARERVMALEVAHTQAMDAAREGAIGLGGTDTGATLNEARAYAAALEERIVLLGGLVQEQEQITRLTREQVAAQQTLTQISRDREGVDNLRNELDMRNSIIGLTEEQARVQRMLAQEGLLGVDIQQRINTLEESRLALMRQGMDSSTLNTLLAEYRNELESVLAVQEDLLAAAARAAQFRADAAQTETLGQQNALLTAQVALMQEGLTASESRVQAEYDIAAAQAMQRMFDEELTAAEREGARVLLEQLATRLNLQRALEAEEQRQRAINDTIAAGQTLIENVIARYNDAADAYQRGQEAGRARIADLENEIQLAQAILQFGNDSAEVEEVRRQQAAAVVEEFIKQNNLAPQIANSLRQMSAEAFNLQNALRGATSEADALAAALARAAGVSAGLQSSVTGLRAQLNAAREGADQYTQARVRQLAIERENLMVESGTLRQRGEALMRQAEITALLSEQEQLQRSIAEANARPAGGSSPGGGAAEQELATLQGIVAEMEQRLARERELIGLYGAERRQLELIYELQDRLSAEGLEYSQEAVAQAAARLAALEQETQAILEYQDRMQGLADGLSGAFADFFRDGFRDFEGFTDSILDLFSNMLAKMVAEAASQQIMFSLGLGPKPEGGIFAAIRNMAGGGMAAGAAPATAGAAGGGGILSNLLGGAGAAGALGGLGGAIGALAGPIGIAVGLFGIFRQRQQQSNDQNKRIEDERYRLETRRLELLGRTRELREREIEKLHSSNRELGRLVQTLEIKAAIDEEARALQLRMAVATGDAVAIRKAEMQAVDAANRALLRSVLIAEQRAPLEVRLLQLQGKTTELRRRELQLLDPTNRDLQRQIWRLEDLAAAQEALNRGSSERYNLMTRLLQLEGNIERLRRRELRLLEPMNRELQRRIWQLEDAARIADEYYGLETRLLQLQGNTVELRRRELERLDESNHAIQRQIWMLEDMNKALNEIDMNDFVTLVDYNRAVARATMGLTPVTAPSMATMTLPQSTPQVSSSPVSTDAETRAAVDRLTTITQQLLTRIDNNTRRSSLVLQAWDDDGIPEERS